MFTKILKHIVWLIDSMATIQLEILLENVIKTRILLVTQAGMLKKSYQLTMIY